MNSVIYSGRLTNDLKTVSTQSGKLMYCGCIAVKRDYKNSHGEYDSDFIDFIGYERLKFLADYAHKGDLVAIKGRTLTRTYTDKDGKNRKAVDTVVDNCEILQKKQVSNQPINDQVFNDAEPIVQADTYEISPDDLPF